MLLVIVKANLYGDNSFTTNGNFLVSNYGVKYNLLLTVNNIEILFKFKCGAGPSVFQEALTKPERKQTETIPTPVSFVMNTQPIRVTVLSSSLRSLKLSDFLERTVRKHFHQYVRHAIPCMTLQIY